MPSLEFHPELNASADQVLAALASVGMYETFIPGCKHSTILNCAARSDIVWEGTARQSYEFKKYAIHEEATFDFRVDSDRRTIRFEVRKAEAGTFNATAIYSIEPQGQDRCRVKAAIEYDVPGKKYFWVMAKPLIGRFFQKFIGLIEKRAQALNGQADLSFSIGSKAGEANTSVRGFRQLDERTYNARMKLLSQFPPGSVGAEVGTYMGAFAQLIVDTVKPTKLYLIDPWVASNSESQAGSWYETVDQTYMDNVFQMVSQRFSNGANGSSVNIIRDYSASALNNLEDGELDWIYIDGDHSYDAVLKDLRLGFDKVRTGGFISGDDYEIVDTWWKDNVVRAVTEFAAAYQVEFVLQEGAQFLLRKK